MDQQQSQPNHKGIQDRHQRAKRAQRDPVRAEVTRLRDLARSEPDSPLAQRARELIAEWEQGQLARKKAERAAEQAQRLREQRAEHMAALMAFYGCTEAELLALDEERWALALERWRQEGAKAEAGTGSQGPGVVTVSTPAAPK